MVASLESTVREISPQAIARELALRLAPQATYVRVAHSAEGWKILLEAEQIPNQRTCLDVLVAFLSPVLPNPLMSMGDSWGAAPCMGSTSAASAGLQPPHPQQFAIASLNP